MCNDAVINRKGKKTEPDQIIAYYEAARNSTAVSEVDKATFLETASVYKKDKQILIIDDLASLNSEAKNQLAQSDYSALAAYTG